MTTFAVKLFARAAELAGATEVGVAVELPATVGDVVAELVDGNAGLGGLLRRCRVAVNLAFVNADEPVRPGDEIAVIPPVSGG